MNNYFAGAASIAWLMHWFWRGVWKVTMSEIKPKGCAKCGQIDTGQRGEVPCDQCGLPLLVYAPGLKVSLQKIVPGVDYRNAFDGKYVSDDYAELNPYTTVGETSAAQDFSILDCVAESELEPFRDALKASTHPHPRKAAWIAECDRRLDLARG